MTTTLVVLISVTVNGNPIQDFTHPDDHIPLTHETANYIKCIVFQLLEDSPSLSIGIHSNLMK